MVLNKDNYKVRVCVNHEGKSVIVPLLSYKFPKFIGFLKNYYLSEFDVDTATVKEMFKDLDNLIFTRR